RLFASPAALESPEFANGVGRAAEAIVIREIRDRDGNAAAIEVFWRGDDDPGGARELAGQERRIGLIAEAKREIRALGDEVLVAVGHHELDFERRTQRQKAGEMRNDLPHAKGGRQADAQNA